MTIRNLIKRIAKVFMNNDIYILICISYFYPFIALAFVTKNIFIRILIRILTEKLLKIIKKYKIIRIGIL